MIERFLLRGIAWYRRRISPAKGRSVCRFQPTCSRYAQTAIERYGAWRGGWMALRRLIRCNPLCKGGYDPVPYDPRTDLRRE